MRSGGTLEQVIRLYASRFEITRRWRQFLPVRGHFAFYPHCNHGHYYVIVVKNSIIYWKSRASRAYPVRIRLPYAHELDLQYEGRHDEQYARFVEG